jgi:hypothetical protein
MEMNSYLTVIKRTTVLYPKNVMHIIIIIMMGGLRLCPVLLVSLSTGRLTGQLFGRYITYRAGNTLLVSGK